MKNISALHYFQKFGMEPRPQQVAALNWLHENWDKYDYFVLQLPTGVGKTHFALSGTNKCKDAWMATSTLQLMDQYIKSDNCVIDLRGRSNYQCQVVDSATCEYGPCKTDQNLGIHCRKNELCPYENQKTKAMMAKWTITNYAYLISCAYQGFLSQTQEKLPPPPRSVSVFDEAHNLEKHLISFATMTYKIDDMKKHNYIKLDYKPNTSLINNCNILKNIHSELLKLADELDSQISEIYAAHRKSGKKSFGSKYVSADGQKIQQLVSRKKTIDKFLQPLNFWMDTRDENPNNDLRWIIHFEENDNAIRLVPLMADFIFNLYFNKKISEKFIFMSATIGDPDVFCRENGIPREKAVFFETDSPFDPKLSPIFVVTGKDSVNTRFGIIDSQLDKITRTVEKIMDAHKTDGGIIHTGNYKIARHIWTTLKPVYKSRILFKEMDSDLSVKNDELLERHEAAIKAGKPSVLLSPSLMEGVDLKDDLSRWQLIVKLPFASLGDIRVKRKNELSNGWYMNEMLVKLVQACGRSTRSDTDWSKTYIIDDMFSQVLSRAKLPQWFRSRLIMIKD